MVHDEPLYRFNTDTHYFEYEEEVTVILRRRLDPEVFRGVHILALEEDEAADLTNMDEYQRITNRVLRVSFWEGKSAVTVTYEYAGTPIAEPAHTVRTASTATPIASAEPVLTLQQQREAYLRERLYTVPPYLWMSQCLTPLQPRTASQEERDERYRLREEEGKIVKKLRTAWETHTAWGSMGNVPMLIEISAEAAEEQRLYQENNQQASPMEVFTAVAQELNNNRLN